MEEHLERSKLPFIFKNVNKQGFARKMECLQQRHSQ